MPFTFWFREWKRQWALNHREILVTVPHGRRLRADAAVLLSLFVSKEWRQNIYQYMWLISTLSHQCSLNFILNVLLAFWAVIMYFRWLIGERTKLQSCPSQMIYNSASGSWPVQGKSPSMHLRDLLYLWPHHPTPLWFYSGDIQIFKFNLSSVCFGRSADIDLSQTCWWVSASACVFIFFTYNAARGTVGQNILQMVF